ncbi:MAG TPA: hypothetical protein VFV52_06725 [Bacilli bacterium]|nr:hypothetical protein [Bacilli bacterium]
MHEISWSNVWITLLLPFLAVLWMHYVIRRKSAMYPATEPTGTGTKVVVYVIGFVVTWFVATYLGLYLVGMMQLDSGMVSDGDRTLGTIVSFAGLFVSGLWGALAPYRMLARAGKRSNGLWLGLALVYAVLFYLSTLFF